MLKILNESKENDIKGKYFRAYIAASHSLAIVLELGVLGFTKEEFLSTRTSMTAALAIPAVLGRYNTILQIISEKIGLHGEGLKDLYEEFMVANSKKEYSEGIQKLAKVWVRDACSFGLSMTPVYALATAILPALLNHITNSEVLVQPDIGKIGENIIIGLTLAPLLGLRFSETYNMYAELLSKLENKRNRLLKVLSLEETEDANHEKYKKIGY